MLYLCAVSARISGCDECQGGSTGIVFEENCYRDCTGLKYGTALLNNCGDCQGGTTGIPFQPLCYMDCAGVKNGNAYIDDYGYCAGYTVYLPSGDSILKPPCEYDCRGQIIFDGEVARLDDCGDCIGGKTGIRSYGRNATGSESLVHPGTDGTAKPEDDPDCTDANKAMQKIQENILNDDTVKVTADSLRKNATSPDTRREYASSVQYNARYYTATKELDSYFSTAEIVEGDSTGTQVKYEASEHFDLYTVMTMHSHQEHAGSNGTRNYTPPSAQDVLATIQSAISNRDKKAKNEPQNYPDSLMHSDSLFQYVGELVTAYDSSEYFLYVKDVNLAKEFLKRFPNFADIGTGKFKNEELKKDYLQVLTNLQIGMYRNDNQNFSTNAAQNFALVYVLQKYNSGIVVLKKEKDSDSFEEQSVRVEQTKNGKNKYTPVSK